MTVLGWARWAASLGAGVGLVVGVFEATAIDQAVRTERAAVRAEELRDRHEFLDYLNSLLRHEVLNSANVIEGYAQRIEESSPDGSDEQRCASVIASQAADLTDVTRNIRLLLQSVEGETDLEPVDVGALLEEELRKFRERHPEAETESALPDGVFVRADDLLPRVFANLFDNAVEHNDSGTPRVEVTVTTSPETVEVRVADNGPGVPEEQREGLFEMTAGRADHGIGLTIIARLVERYDGQVELADTGPEGSVFSLSLPRASPDSGAANPDRPSAERHPRHGRAVNESSRTP